MKRFFDVVLSLAGLVIAVPVLLVLIPAIRMTSKGPAIFRQTRVGRNERLFSCLKLRTMYCETENLPSHEVSIAAVTPLGHKLRRYKLDELPQLWNVLRGEMSLVGPRPCLPSQHQLIVARRRRGLYALRPGITGIAQVAGIDMSDPERLAEVEAEYLDEQSLPTDIRLVMQTIRGRGRGDRIR